MLNRPKTTSASFNQLLLAAFCLGAAACGAEPAETVPSNDTSMELDARVDSESTEEVDADEVADLSELDTSEDVETDEISDSSQDTEPEDLETEDMATEDVDDTLDAEALDIPELPDEPDVDAAPDDAEVSTDAEVMDDADVMEELDATEDAESLDDAELSDDLDAQDLDAVETPDEVGSDDVDVEDDAEIMADTDIIDVTLNACGGLEVLPAEPGENCGLCGDGRWECSGTETLACAGDRINACGGCEELTESPGELCGLCGLNEVACLDANSAACNGNTMDACGGCGLLEGNPGEACGPCGWDVLACGADGLACSGSTTDSCGACEDQTRAEGETCGGCDRGLWQCTDEGWDCDTTGAEPCGVLDWGLKGPIGCLLLEDFSVWCWGNYMEGNPLQPRKVEGLPPIVEISMGSRLGVGVDGGGGVWTWGFEHPGDLNLGNGQWIVSQAVVGSDFTAFGIGRGDVLCVAESNTFQCSDVLGVTPDGNITQDEMFDAPIEWIPEEMYSTYAVLDAEHNLWIWGSNAARAAGIRTPTTIRDPVVHPHSPIDPSDIFAIRGPAAALARDNRLICWGDTGTGEPDCGESREREFEGRVYHFESEIERLVASEKIFLIQLVDGRVYGLGHLPADGLYDWLYLEQPTLLELPFVPIDMVASAHSFCAMSEDQRVWCVGPADLSIVTWFENGQSYVAKWIEW